MIHHAALRHRDGRTIDARRWSDAADDVDARVLAHAIGPVLDIGCGPGRHLVALAERGIVALGIDIAPAALAMARDRGATALHRSVFDHVPAAGRWCTALILDGTIGIGGDVDAVLRRTHELLAPGGQAIVEATGAGAGGTATVRIEVGARPGPWFEMAPVAIGDVLASAPAAGFPTVACWTDCGRTFASLVAT